MSAYTKEEIAEILKLHRSYLGGEPSFERLQHVIAYMTGGRGVPE